jgi:AcrR family transcriptional regulator
LVGHPTFNIGAIVIISDRRVSTNREKKIDSILYASLKVLATKGYENATIADISKAAHVSRGILHYYFSDKEDLVSKTLAKSSDSLVQSMLLEVKRNSAEELVDDILNGYIMNLQQHPDFYSFLFEMWCASRRSKKIRHELEICVEKVVNAIQGLLKDTQENGITNFNPGESKEKARALLALSDGIAFHLLLNPDPVNVKDKKFWLQVRSMMLAALKN